MINFDTLKLAVYMAEEFRAGRYGFILYNPELKVFGIIGPFKKMKNIFLLQVLLHIVLLLRIIKLVLIKR